MRADSAAPKERSTIILKVKETLFEAYVLSECQSITDGLLCAPDSQGTIAKLQVFGETLLTQLLSVSSVRAYQLVIAEAHRAPKLANAFYEAGPAAALTLLRALLKDAAAIGDIETNAFDVAAQQFMALCRGDLHFRYALNIIPRPSRAEVKEAITDAVVTFMGRYGAGHRTG